MKTLVFDQARSERPKTGCSSPVTAMKRARHCQDLARRHRDEESFWLCRASYFGRLSLRKQARGPSAGDIRPSHDDTTTPSAITRGLVPASYRCDALNRTARRA